MGRFFNQVVKPMRKIPLGKTNPRDSLEALRKKFNEEQNVKPIYSEKSTEAGVASSDGSEQIKPIPDIPPRRNRTKRVKRIGKSVVAETRRNKGV